MQLCAEKTLLDFPDKWGDVDICHLIMENEGYIVFIDKQLDVDWKITDELDKEQKESKAKRNEILNKAANVESIPNIQQKPLVRLNFKRMVGEGIARAFDADWDNAARIISEADKYIRERNSELARYWQLSMAIVLGVSSLFAGATMWSLRGVFVEVIGGSGYQVALGALVGMSGAVLSMILRIGRLNVSSESEKNLHYLEVCGRCLVGANSAILVALLIKAEFILPALKGTASGLPMILAACLLAGASERWAPSIVSKFEGRQVKKKSEGRTDEKKSSNN